MVAGLSSSAMSTTGLTGAFTAGSSWKIKGGPGLHDAVPGPHYPRVRAAPHPSQVARTRRRCRRRAPSLMAMGAMDEAERLEPTAVEEWTRVAARAPHAAARGVAGVSPRKAAERAFSYEEAVLEALRCGWVDSTVKPVDEHRSMQWFAPRRPGSMWTRINKGRVARLEEAGLMEPAGAAAVAVAKETGMWTLMDDVEDLRRAGRPGRGVRAPPGLARALGVVVGVGAEDDPDLDRAGQEARDPGRARRDDGREGRARARSRSPSDAVAQIGAAVGAALLAAATSSHHLDGRVRVGPRLLQHLGERPRSAARRRRRTSGRSRRTARRWRRRPAPARRRRARRPRTRGRPSTSSTRAPSRPAATATSRSTAWSATLRASVK